MPPIVSSITKSPQHKQTRNADAGYFGFVVNDESIPPDSNPGHHAKQNWDYPSSSRSSFGASPKQQTQETNPAFDLFRRQSEQNHRFNLSNNVAGLQGQSSPTFPLKPGIESPISPTQHAISIDQTDFDRSGPSKQPSGQKSFFDIPRQASPTPMSPKHSVADHQHARLSLPAAELKASLDAMHKQRSETLPQVNSSGPDMVSVQEVANIIQTKPDEVLIFDLRVYQQFAGSRVKGALNLCLPTTLLKRPTFTVQKLAETFSSERDKEVFAQWRHRPYIVVYDGNSMQAKEAVMPFNVLKKFSSEGWKGRGLVVKGGFLAFARQMPSLIDKGPSNTVKDASNKPLNMPSPSEGIVPVAGGCSMPVDKSAANPFFGNIRQNMDLMDGVGQMPIKRPSDMSEKDEKRLPKWLREVSRQSDEGKKASDKFLAIEQSEQKRMQQALSSEVLYGTPQAETPNHIRVAGIEKGAKNRYNNIFPYEHTRVKLQGVPRSGCDYINANHVKAKYSNRRYIATQAPIPATFEDFWRAVWEQDVRVIVTLTAESEGGQIKGHPYWNTGDYGQFKIKKLSERQSLIDRYKKEKVASLSRPQMAPRRSTQPHTLGERKIAEETKPAVDSEAPVVTIRHLTVSHSAQPFQPIREVTQIQYSQWPDFGAPTSPLIILGLIDQVNKYVRQSNSSATRPDAAAETEDKPIIVHCSAGCGRTGTFCTIDSVIDMLKRQKLEQHKQNDDEMDIDVPDDWITRDDTDLVAKAVSDFRHQRLSMVQNLRQFVLCYETVLQWVVSQEHDDIRARFMKEGSRRSYQGSLGSR